MDFRIADTFTDSLARMTGDVQKAVKIAVFDLPLTFLPADKNRTLQIDDQT
jgi:hypothetical protein